MIKNALSYLSVFVTLSSGQAMGWDSYPSFTRLSSATFATSASAWRTDTQNSKSDAWGPDWGANQGTLMHSDPLLQERSVASTAVYKHDQVWSDLESAPPLSPIVMPEPSSQISSQAGALRYGDVIDIVHGMPWNALRDARAMIGRTLGVGFNRYGEARIIPMTTQSGMAPPLSPGATCVFGAQGGAVLVSDALHHLKAVFAYHNHTLSPYIASAGAYHGEVRFLNPEDCMAEEGMTLPVTMALLSDLSRIPVRADTAMMGKVLPNGIVGPVGSVREGLTYLQTLGVQRAVVPLDNFLTLDSDFLKGLGAMRLYPVTTLTEAIQSSLKQDGSFFCRHI